MNKRKAREIPDVGPISDKPLIRMDYDYVMVSHQELDNLIAQLMHIAELDSDKEHREALKGELKYRSRSWLDNLYHESGYVNYQHISGANIVEISEADQVTSDSPRGFKATVYTVE